MRAIRLRTEYRTNPIDVTLLKPRFYWNCENGAEQTAYQIIVKRQDEVIWDSQKVLSGRMTHISYEGEELQSRDRLIWCVRLWDEVEQAGEWQSASFEMGLLEKSDWYASWITGDYKPRKNMRYPVDCFQKKFCLSDKKICYGRLYATAHGVYSAKINGVQASNFFLAPGCTDYRKRLQYQVYDVTRQLQPGDNELDVLLADGWYRGSIGCFGKTNVYGRQTALLMQLEIVYEDGTKDVIASDESFAWSNDGPVRFADLKDGEIYDALMTPTYAGSARKMKWLQTPVGSNNVYAIEQEHFRGKLVVTPSGKKVIDFGQNIAGTIAFSVQGKPGQQIKLTFGEIIDELGQFGEPGELTQKNMQEERPEKEFGLLTEIHLMMGQKNKIKETLQPTPKQEILFLCSGGVDEYKMQFGVFGFQYALIETEAEVNAADFTAIAVYSDMEQTGRFHCSNEQINQLESNARWSMKGNFLDIPTDCPTRERLGWTGDAQVFFQSACYFMDAASIYRKWLTDVRDNQFKDGKVSAVVPYAGIGMLYDNTGTSVGWGDAVILIPYRFWKEYGDREILKENYDVMRKYAQFMIKHTGFADKKKNREFIYSKYVYEKGVHLGEWLEPEKFQDKEVGKGVLHTEECTAYLHYTMMHMAQIAEELGYYEEQKLYQEYSAGAAKAYELLFIPEEGINTDRQAKLVRPLALGVADGEKKQLLQKRLKLAVEHENYHVGTGFLSTPFLLSTLTEAGYVEEAYKVLENEEAPGWLAEVKQNATTVWEDWEGKGSHNHYSPGAVCQWLYDTVAGIKVAGENEFVIQPIPGGQLTFAKAEYRSIYGTVQCSWEKTQDTYQFVISIPENTKAIIILPNGEITKVNAGTYQFSA